ncbi:hypothetical protein NDU88_005658 [Pleurodeles waltl]|uniref:Uncharacterized protein n=1 Tax=Pleurodeles waltl TaxID=8319 RepID=A0AAV7QGB8_PLEWA|nr:hypothetical protein NDU88_005658 [Pleurodeles waltl]
MELETFTAVMFDHNPVLFTTGDVIENQQQSNFKKADWCLYKRNLDKTLVPDPLGCIEDIDQVVDRLTAAVHIAIKAAFFNPNAVPSTTS